MVKHASAADMAPDTAADTDRDVTTETKILDAAHAVFLRVGTAGARMQEIADEAGVNKALLHYYFRSKERLAAAVFERVARGLFARLGMAATADVDLETKVRRIVAAYLDEFVRTPYVPGYVICEMNQNPDRAKQLLSMIGAPVGDGGPGVPFLGALAKQIDARVAAGGMRPISSRQFVANLVSLCVFPFAARPMLCAVFHMDDAGFREFIEERKTSLREFFLNALRP
jgi:AcrR family transcriptional regulator